MVGKAKRVRRVRMGCAVRRSSIVWGVFCIFVYLYREKGNLRQLKTYD